MGRPRRFAALTIEPGVREITLAGRPVAYTVKRSRRAADWRLEFSSRAGLVVVLPQSYDVAAAERILASKERWVLSRLAEAAVQERVGAERRLRHGGPFSYRGEDYALRCDGGLTPRGAVAVDDHTITVGVPPDAGDELRAAVLAWLRARAREEITPVVARESAAMGVAFRRLYIRDQRTRWASCSVAGNLSFSCRLAMAPAYVVRYLVVHELAHLRTMRHGKRFRQLVARRCDDHRAAERWLRENEARLTF
jgi:hypothetical protein